MEASPSSGPGLKRSLSVWAAVGLSVALMAPSMAANINPQGSATGAAAWFPVVSGIWLAVAVIAVIFAAGTARKLGAALAAREGIRAPGTEEPEPRLAAARDETA